MKNIKMLFVSMFIIFLSVNNFSYADDLNINNKKAYKFVEKKRTFRKIPYVIAQIKEKTVKFVTVKKSFKRISYMEQIEDSNNKKVSVIVNTFPNPVEEKLNMNINSAISDNAEIQIYSSQGIIVSKSDLKLEEGFNTISFNTGDYSPGIYFFKITINNEGYSGSFVVMK